MNHKDEAESVLEPGSPTEPAPFGNYELLGLLARGGMAEVFRARHRDQPHRILAIKCMRPHLARDERFVDMFIREGKLSLLLRHPNIVETYDVGQIRQRYFMTMEYIGGKDLTQVMRRCQDLNHRIPIPHALYIVCAIARGLHYAHVLTDLTGRNLNIVNRDVSPSNVRIAYTGQVKLLDFGIAQALMKFTTEIGVLKGKLSYMSPEQVRGMPLDARSDVFSAGILLHELLTREKLFRGDTEFVIMEKVREAEILPPSRFNHRVPPELDVLCLKALARDANQRYQTAAMLADDLARFLTQYHWDGAELQDFIRRLFRTEHAREEEEVLACTTAKVSERPSEQEETVPARHPPPNHAVEDTPAASASYHHPKTISRRRSVIWKRLRSRWGK